MLVHAWTSHAFSDGAPSWSDWLTHLTRHHRVPPRTDLATIAATWARRLGASRVRIVLQPDAVPRLVGVRRSLPSGPDLSADAVDLARRVALVLGMLVPPADRAPLLHEVLLPRLRDAPGPRLAITGATVPWVVERAERMRNAILAAGYAVSGHPDQLRPSSGARADAEIGGPTDDGVLALAMALLVDRPVAEKEGDR